MADVLRVDEHPQGCTICMAVAGPFVVYKLAGYTVQTVEGPIQVDTEFALCARTDGREGCAGQGARLDGYVAPTSTRTSSASSADLLEQHAELEVARRARAGDARPQAARPGGRRGDHREGRLVAADSQLAARGALRRAYRRRRRRRRRRLAGNPLAILLARYPKLNAPGITNVSMKHMQGMAKRANTSAVHGSVLRDFLAGV
jgi:hypothetical protein